MKYSKYTGLGNDFIAGMYQEGINYNEFAKKVCNRYIGLGADGLLICKLDDIPQMMFYNADGSRAPMCGNGIRCFIKYLFDEGISKDKEIKVKTLSGIRKAIINSTNPFVVEVEMGKPDYSRKRLDIDGEGDFLDQEIEYKNEIIKMNGVFMTTHHLVVIVDDLNKTIQSDLGKFLCTNKIFNKGINVNFVQIIDKNNCYMKTYERGVGWTYACGSGACSAFAILNKKGLCNDELTINLTYGKLLIKKGYEDSIIMCGEAVRIASEIVFD